MSEAETTAVDALVEDLAEEAGIALSDEVGPAALAGLADETRVVPSGEALLTIYVE